MNQVFRINVGPETVQGRLPAVRVGLGFGCRFHISGVDHVADVPAPKIWITRKEAETLYWEAEWNETFGVWVATIGSDATADVGTYVYALTMYGDDVNAEFIAGQGAFAVYDSIAYAGGGGGTGGTGGTGSSFGDRVIALETKMTAVEARFAELAGLAMFDAAQAFDYELRQQIEAITNMLRGNQT